MWHEPTTRYLVFELREISPLPLLGELPTTSCLGPTYVAIHEQYQTIQAGLQNPKSNGRYYEIFLVHRMADVRTGPVSRHWEELGLCESLHITLALAKPGSYWISRTSWCRIGMC